MKLNDKLANAYTDYVNFYGVESEVEIARKAYLAGFEAALDLAAKQFEGHEQTFNTEDDSVEFTYRVMSIISQYIRKTGE
jgi:hypothetical protein